MKGINRAIEPNIDVIVENLERTVLFSSAQSVPCVFISYQRADEVYALRVADYIISKQIDVYFDLNDHDLKLQMQRDNPEEVTSAIRKGLNQSDYMLVIISPTTYTSPWVPFEIGYAYDNKGDNLKLLRHKGIAKITMPAYLKTREVLLGFKSLNNFLNDVRKSSFIYESLMKKGEEVKSFSNANTLTDYLDNE